MANTPSSQQSQQRDVQRLFQSKRFSALFGRSAATLVTRLMFIVAAVGTLAIIIIGLLRPGTPTTSTNILQSSTSSSSSASVGLQSIAVYSKLYYHQ